MSVLVPSVITRRSDVVTVRANVGNVDTVYVTSLGGSGPNVVLADAGGLLVGSAVTATTLSYLQGATSNIQQQLNDARNNNSANTLTVANSFVLASQTASRVLVLDATSNVVSSAVTAATLGYLDATSSVQGQLNAKQGVVTGGASSIVTANLAASKALVSDAAGKVAASAVTATTLGYLDATSSVQGQLDARANLSGATFTGSVIVTGNLTVLGNTTTISTEQLEVEDPVLVLNSGKVSQSTGLYLAQAGAADAAALLFQGGNVELISTATAADAASYVASGYLPLVTGALTARANARVTGVVTVVPPAASNGYMCSARGTYGSAANVHTIAASAIDAANGGTGVFSGQLLVFVTNNSLTGTNKTGFATVSLIKSPADFDVVPISIHRNVNLAEFNIGRSAVGTDVVVITDADCAVSWKFEGCTIR